MAAFLVTGATGRQGGSTARRLLAKGCKVHALVRDPDSEAAKAIQAEGAILFKGDSADAKAISHALEGVTGVFYNPPFPGPDAARTNQIFIQTCTEWKDTVNTLVVSSVSGTETHAEAMKENPHYPMAEFFGPKAALEDAARAGGFQNVVILRPGFLVYEYLPAYSTVIFPGLEQKRLATALKPDTVIPHLVAEDVGKFAVAALLEPQRWNGKAINLASANLTVSEAAEIIGEVAGVKIETPIATFKDGKAVGIESPIARYHEWANEVDASVDVDALKQDYGIPLTSLREFLTERRELLNQAVGI